MAKQNFALYNFKEKIMKTKFSNKGWYYYNLFSNYQKDSYITALFIYSYVLKEIE